MVALKELIMNSCYIGRVWWSWKNWFLTVWHLGCCSGFARSDFKQFLLWADVVVLTEFIFNTFYIGMLWWSWKNWFFTVFTLGCCGGLDRTGFFTVSTLGVCGGPGRTDFQQFPLWEGVVILKDFIFFCSFYFERVWWSWKDWFFTVYHLGACSGLEITNF